METIKQVNIKHRTYVYNDIINLDEFDSKMTMLIMTFSKTSKWLMACSKLAKWWFNIVVLNRAR